MKLFSDPIPVENVELNKFYKFVYRSITAQGQEIIKYCYGDVLEVTPEHFRIICYTGANYGGGNVVTLPINELLFIHSVNINFNEHYLFQLDNSDDLIVNGFIIKPSQNGITNIKRNNDMQQNYNNSNVAAMQIHMSQITGVLPMNEYSYVLYPAGLRDNMQIYTAIDEHRDLFPGGTRRNNKSLKKRHRRKN